MNSKLTTRIKQLKADRIHGAHWLSVKALNILNLAIRESQADTVGGFLNELEIIAATIAATRPGMVSITNYISYFVNEISKCFKKQKTIKDFKNNASSKLHKLIEYSKTSSTVAAKNAAALINYGDTAITCSYSFTICNMLRIALKRVTKLNVVIVESRYSGVDYGEISFKELRKHNIPSIVIPQDKTTRYMKQVNVAFIGADTVWADGSLINGIPSYLLAKIAAKENIKFYSVCETAKFDMSHASDRVSHIEPGFELVPSELIAGIITEEGMINSSIISDFKFKWKNSDENY
jgi:ribose 1,5-bisphosphate isomerase